MSAITLKSTWKYKIEPTNIFDDNFLKEKDSALQPIDFFIEDQILISNNNIIYINLIIKYNKIYII